MKKIFIYDFDGTITPKPMPDLKILEVCGYKGGLNNERFKDMIANIKDETNMDRYDALYKSYLNAIWNNGIKIKDKELTLGYDEITYNKGIREFLDYLNNRGVTNYVVSSGIKKLMDKSSIAKHFKYIYGTTFTYKNGYVTGLYYVLSDKKKVDAIKNIEAKENALTKDIVYVGDGLTDYYAFKYVHDNGGITLCVCEKDNEKVINTLKSDGVITEFFNPDYSENSDLYEYVKSLLK